MNNMQLERFVPGVIVWLENRDIPKRSRSEINRVYQVWVETVPNDLCERVFFKVGHKENKNLTNLRAMMWKIVQILGVERFFVRSIRMEYKGVVGLLQEFQPGNKCDYYIPQKEKPFSLETFTEASLLTLVMGMFDAHCDNIIIDPEGNIKFYDDDKCFPHSSSMLFDLELMLPAFRSGLLEFDLNFVPMTEDQKELIKTKLAQYQEKFAEVEKYLQEDMSLTPGCFYPDLVIEETKLRMERVALALNDENVKTIFDLVCYVIPNYRFICSIMAYSKFVFGKSKLDEAKRFGAAYAGRISDKDLKGAYENCKKYDMGKLLVDAGNLAITYEDIILGLVEGRYNAEVCFPYDSFIQLIKDLGKEAMPTYHGASVLNKATTDKFFFDTLPIKYFIYNSLPIWSENFEIYVKAIRNGTSYDYSIIVRGVGSFPLDIHSKPGYVLIKDHPPMRVNELANFGK